MARSKRFIALDIGSSTVKIAELSGTADGGLKLLGFGMAEIQGMSSQEEEAGTAIVSTVRKLMKDRKIRPAPAVISVSAQQVFTRFTKLPPVGKDKIKDIIRYEAQQNVPIPIEELVWDFQVTSLDGAPETEVVLVAIKSNIVENLVASVESAGLRVNIIDVSPMALYNSVRYNYGDIEGCVVLADIGARTTNLVFIEPTKLYTRSIPVGGQAMTQAISQEFNIDLIEAEAMKRAKGFVADGATYESENDERARLAQVLRGTMNRLEGEIRRTINLYRSQQGGQAPSLLLLSGATTMIQDMDQYFRDKYPNLTIEFFNPFKNIEIVDGLSREELMAVTPYFGEVIGLGMREVAKCHMEINLLPPRTTAVRKSANRRPWILATAVIVLAFIWGWSNMHTKEILNMRQGDLDSIKDNIQIWDKAAKEIQVNQDRFFATKAKVNELEELIDANDYWARLFSDLNSRLPEYVWITLLESKGKEGKAPVTSGGAPLDKSVGAGPPAAPVQANTNLVSLEYVVEGKGVLTDKSQTGASIVGMLIRNLQQSEFVDGANTEEIDAAVEPAEGDFIFSFKIKVTLLKPKMI